MSHEDLLKMRGGIKSKIHSRPPVAPASPFVRRQAEFLPDEWDWRNVSGVNYVPVVKYAFPWYLIDWFYIIETCIVGIKEAVEAVMPFPLWECWSHVYELPPRTRCK